MKKSGLMARPGKASRLCSALAAMIGALGGPAFAQPTDAEPAAIPLTHVGPNGVGLLADPQPIRLAPFTEHRVQYLSGTTMAIIAGDYPIKPGSFSWTPIHVDAADLKDQMAMADVTVTNIQNTDIFQDDKGAWHAAVTVGVHSTAHPKHWTVVCHAHPLDQGQGGAPPTQWRADTVLAGSFANPVEGNYDGKYFEDDGRLYLLYVQNYAPKPALRNEIVLQPMSSPRQVSEPPVVLLSPGDRYGALSSERFGNTQAELTEAPYITRINGKYALVYSTGSYLTDGYKAGVAWSDTLMPMPRGPLSRYRKVLAPDPAGVWGQPGTPEVRYLVQSQKQGWPNFTASTVIGPGVAAAVQGPGGAYWLYFNGFAPPAIPTKPNGQVNGAVRHPYAVRLRAEVPSNRSVNAVSDAELATWLTPVMR